MVGRSVLDFLRHNVGFAMRHDYPTTLKFWQKAYVGSQARVIREWGRTGFANLRDYEFKGAQGKGRSTWAEDVPPTGRSLIVGSGTSRLGLDMFEAGWQSVTHMDFAPAVIEDREEQPGLEWVLGDARDLGAVFDNKTELFDSLIDKGTVDSIYLSGSQKHLEDIENIVDGAARIAKRGGRFFIFSLTQPIYLRRILHTVKTSHYWEWDKLQVRQLEFVYMYILTRRHNLYKLSGDETTKQLKGSRKKKHKFNRLRGGR